jgi:hypothetical protein
VTLELPAAPRVVVGTTPVEYAVGNVLDEGFLLALQVTPLQAPVGIDELPTLAEEIRTSAPTLGHPDGSREDGPVRIERRGAAIVIAQDFTNANDTRFEHRIAVRPHAVVNVQVVRRRDDTRSNNLAMRVAESVHDVPVRSAP